MTGMGIPRLTVSKILNHAEPGVTAVYDRHSYDNEKRAALEAWARRLTLLVSDLKEVKTEA
jgi:integrase